MDMKPRLLSARLVARLLNVSLLLGVSINFMKE
jgi:hypothetical protein